MNDIQHVYQELEAALSEHRLWALPKGGLTCRLSSWGRLDSNQRPTDYESAGLNN